MIVLGAPEKPNKTFRNLWQVTRMANLMTIITWIDKEINYKKKLQTSVKHNLSNPFQAQSLKKGKNPMTNIVYRLYR